MVALPRPGPCNGLWLKAKPWLERALVPHAAGPDRRHPAPRGLTTRDATQAIRFVRKLRRSIELATERSAAQEPVPDCKAGCAHCCSLHVEVMEPESFRIARTVRGLPTRRRDVRVWLRRQPRCPVFQ